MPEAMNGITSAWTAPAPHAHAHITAARRVFHNGSHVNGTTIGGAPSSTSSASSLEAVCADVNTRITRLLEDQGDDEALRSVQGQVRVSLGVIGDALDKYTPEHLSISYNGGKDCLVLLVLYLAALYRYRQNHTPKPNGTASTTTAPTPSPKNLAATAIETIYIQPEHPFPEVDDFVSDTAAEYNLALTVLRLPMKAAFTEYLRLRPAVQAIFVGTRRTDPHGATLTHFDATTNDWPTFMRVHPVVDWHYRDIWTFIRLMNIPYCPLYDQGFTSLGGIYDTFPNPALRAPTADATADGKAAVLRYRPAYELLEDSEERLGRDAHDKRT